MAEVYRMRGAPEAQKKDKKPLPPWLKVLTGCSVGCLSLIALGMVSLFILVAANMPKPIDPNAPQIAWEASYPAASAKAAQNQSLMMVDVYTDWCGWCKELDRTTYRDPDVVRASSQYVNVKIDAEKEGLGVAQQYNVHGYPTILFIAPDNTVFTRVVGYKKPRDFASELNRIAAAYAGTTPAHVQASQTSSVQ